MPMSARVCFNTFLFCAFSLNAESQWRDKSFSAFIGDYCFIHVFEKDGDYLEYNWSSNSSATTGCYDWKSDTIRLLSRSYIFRADLQPPNFDEVFIIDKDGDLVSLNSSFAFQPCTTPINCECRAVQSKPVVYPQHESSDTNVKTLVAKSLISLLEHPSVRRLLRKDFDTISIANYYLLNDTAQLDLSTSSRAVRFLKQEVCVRSSYVEIKSVNAAPKELTFNLILHRAIKRKVYARFRKKTSW
jgi:hypothetical protein